MLSGWQPPTEIATLGIWGPGSMVVPSMLAGGTLQLTSLSSVQVEEWIPSVDERQQFQGEQLQQLTNLLLFSRIRPAEERLFHLLLWLGRRFGRVSSRGVSLSFVAMNLTHQHLADISGLTRVTVTKALTRFRKEGRLIREGEDELLRPDHCNPTACNQAPGT
ncbi:Crp/Fnr family transcriptional regulator [Synechococcus sp. GreenBA-s]|nr:Crp/Fnr family transcriptional regulator [Synechococcus sp. GreenBA-s]